MSVLASRGDEPACARAEDLILYLCFACLLPYDQDNDGGATMAILKVVEILAQSEKSWEDAAQLAVQEAAKTVRNIKSIYIQEMEATVENDRITHYRVNAKISFEIEGR
jgi:dodecin